MGRCEEPSQSPEEGIESKGDETRLTDGRADGRYLLAIGYVANSPNALLALHSYDSCVRRVTRL